MQASFSENMNTEHSCGIIPLQNRQGEWYTLLVKLYSGNHWSFPKGHVNPGETAQQTAERELFEETQLRVIEWLPFDPLEESYSFKRHHALTSKTVLYFLAIVEGEVTIQPEEIAAFEWVKLSDAPSHLTYDPVKDIAKKAHSLVYE